MDIRLLKKWRTIAHELFFKDLNIQFSKRIQINFSKLHTWENFSNNAVSTKSVDLISFFDDEKICAKDLRLELQKSYKDFICEYIKYMILKTKKKHPYKRFRIRFFMTKRR